MSQAGFGASPGARSASRVLPALAFLRGRASRMATEPAPRGTVPDPDELLDTEIARLLSIASPRTVDGLLMAARGSSFMARAVVTRQGDALSLAVLLAGVAAVRRTGPEGQTFTVRLLRPGQVAGLRSLREDCPAMFGVVALTPVWIVLWPGAVVRRLAEQDTPFALALLDLAVGTPEPLIARLDEMTFDSARKRVAATLLSHEELLAARPPIVSRMDLAGLVGTSREMVGRVIRGLEAEGVVSRDGRAIAIRDRARLEREATAGGAPEDWLGA